jgi:uncharacterized protein
MASRNVKTIGAALGRTNKPIASPTRVTNRALGDGLENIVAGLGTERDKRSHSRYAIPRVMTRFDLENMFRGSWLSKRIVTAVPDDGTRKWRRFVLADDDTNPNIEALEQEEKKLDVVRKFKEAWYWSRLYGGALIIMGMKDAVNPEDMAKPLDATKIRKGDLKYLHVVDRWRCAPSGKITYDLLSPNFGKPESYIFAESALELHHTRVLRFDGQKLPYFSWLQNGMWDDSDLQHVVESLLNYDTSTAAICSMLFEANIDVVQTKGLTELLSTAAGESKVLRRFQLGQMMKSFNRTLVLDANETYDKKQNQFANIDKIWQQFMVDVCGASHIAMSVLFGVQSGGLDSGGDDDLKNYHLFVAGEQVSKIEPNVNKFDEVFVRHTIGDMPKDYSSEWETLDEVDDTQQAQVDYNNAQRDQIYLQGGVVSEGLVASELKARGTYRTMSDADVKMAEELAQQVDDFQQQQRENFDPNKQPDDEEGGATNNDNKKTNDRDTGNTPQSSAGGAA